LPAREERVDPLSTTPPPPAPLVDPTYLFRFELELQHHRCEWTADGLELPANCRIPNLSTLAGQKRFADVRVAWDQDAIGFSVDVSGKRSLPWCRASRLEDSDAFQLWIDTRCSPGIHRATQFCHHFLFMPTGGGADLHQPAGNLLPINRARQNPNPPSKGSIQYYSKLRSGGYRLSGRLAAGAMTGFDPTQFARIGFFYAVVDRELGWQTLALSRDYPFVEDPSLWAEAALTR
jgi:hypothetical protein